jgi:uncharacterized FlaG/YvyC family protein
MKAILAKAQEANRSLSNFDVKLRFQVSNDASDVRILLIDSATGKVVKTIPPEYFLQRTVRVPELIKFAAPKLE